MSSNDGRVVINYANDAERPELQELCLNCERDDCPGQCAAYHNKWRELHGVDRLKDRGRKGYVRKTDTVRNERIEAFGEAHTLREWARISGIEYGTLWGRVRSKGLTMEEALSQKEPFPKRVIESAGEKHTVRELARLNGLKEQTIRARIYRGMSLEEAATTPLRNSGRRGKPKE